MKELKVDYKLEVLGKVEGNGLNDDIGDYGEGESRKYPIRKLIYKDKIVLEKMSRDPDCDRNDTIISVKFEKEKEPEKWEIEETLKDEKYE